MGFPGGSVVKNPPANAGDAGLIPASGRCPGEGNGNPLPYSWLENPMDRGAWQATVHGILESDTIQWLGTHTTRNHCLVLLSVFQTLNSSSPHPPSNLLPVPLYVPPCLDCILLIFIYHNQQVRPVQTTHTHTHTPVALEPVHHPFQDTIILPRLLHQQSNHKPLILLILSDFLYSAGRVIFLKCKLIPPT